MKLKAAIFFAVVGFLMNACAAKAQTSKSLTEQERYKLAADYSSEKRGVSMLVIKGNKIVFEQYENGFTAETPLELYSGTKSFSGAMLAAAIQDKIISGFDEKVSDTITEWKNDKTKSQITIRQLLSLTSGLDAGGIGRVPTYADAIGAAVKYEPGTHFQYGPTAYQIFGELMTRKLKPRNETVMSYLKRRILDPIGMKVSNWKMLDGQPTLPQGAALTAREWAKYGTFLRDGGKWNGKQIIQKNLLDELVTGSKANPAYGLTLWLNHPGKDPRGRDVASGEPVDVGGGGFVNGFGDLYMAAGAFNQRLYIIPSLDMVVVRQGRIATYKDNEFLSRLLYGKTAN